MRRKPCCAEFSQRMHKRNARKLRAFRLCIRKWLASARHRLTSRLCPGAMHGKSVPRTEVRLRPSGIDFVACRFCKVQGARGSFLKRLSIALCLPPADLPATKQVRVLRNQIWTDRADNTFRDKRTFCHERHRLAKKTGQASTHEIVDHHFSRPAFRVFNSEQA